MVILIHTWLVEADTTISGHFLWAEMEGCTNKAKPVNSPVSGKIAKMALFNPCMEFKFFGGQMTSFEVFKNSFWLSPSGYLGG